MKSMCRPLRAINTYADRIYWVLHLRDMKADWRPTLKAEDPAILFRFTDETLAPFTLHLRPVGPIDVRALWVLRLETAIHTSALSAAQRRGLDALCNALHDFLNLNQQMDECQED